MKKTLIIWQLLWLSTSCKSQNDFV